MKDSSVIHLKEPDRLSLEDAYRSLPGTGEISIDTILPNLTEMLELAEQAGFAGMKTAPFRSPEERILITALKGKQGACYDTGRTADYRGEALAALDDDHHLLFRGMSLGVCEKTANLYSRSPYVDFIACSDPDKDLFDRLHKNPERFEGKRLEDSLEELYEMTRDRSEPSELTDLFYPGPFRLLILDDGTMIHRGRANRIPAQVSNKLMKSDGLTVVNGLQGGSYGSFPASYRREGPRCLLNRSMEKISNTGEKDPDLSLLKEIPGDLRKRLISTISNGKDYFMLTGSNREDQFGCCPSDEVTAADRLVRAGILSATREQAAADACPLNIYAFRNEMSSRDGSVQFDRDQDFRKEVLPRLSNNPVRVLKVWAKWILLLFVAVSVVLSVTRFTGKPAPSQLSSLHERLDLTGNSGTAVVLFHYTKRCAQCLAMEKFTREVLDDRFRGMVEDHQIFFREMEIDRPENRNIVEELGIFTSTIVIVSFEDHVKDSIRVLDRSWALYDNETEFKQMLTDELHQMTGEER